KLDIILQIVLVLSLVAVAEQAHSLNVKTVVIPALITRQHDHKPLEVGTSLTLVAVVHLTTHLVHRAGSTLVRLFVLHVVRRRDTICAITGRRTLNVGIVGVGVVHTASSWVCTNDNYVKIVLLEYPFYFAVDNTPEATALRANAVAAQ